MISLAGPLASLAGAFGTGVLLVSQPFTSFSLLLTLATLGGILLFLESLLPSGDGPESWSDGRWVQLAWREIRARG